jgi:hypothetical protein
MSEQNLVEAINDLARVVIACNDKIGSKADAIRRLHSASITPSRIAVLLDMETKDVTSKISKIKKANGGRRERQRAE